MKSRNAISTLITGTSTCWLMCSLLVGLGNGCTTTEALVSGYESYYSIRADNKELAKRLDGGENPNGIGNHDNRTYLCLAIRRSDNTPAELNGLSIWDRDYEQKLDAAYRVPFDVVKLMLDHGADPNLVCNSSGFVPLEQLVAGMQERKLTFQNDDQKNGFFARKADIAILLIERGARLDVKTQFPGGFDWLPIWLAGTCNEKAMSTVLAQGVSVNVIGRESSGFPGTAPIDRALGCSSAFVKILVEAGARPGPDTVSKVIDGMLGLIDGTPRNQAKLTNSLEVLKLLVGAGAKPPNKTLADVLYMMDRSGGEQTKVILAQTLTVLLDGGADARAYYNGEAPMMRAMRDEFIAKRLVLAIQILARYGQSEAQAKAEIARQQRASDAATERERPAREAAARREAAESDSDARFRCWKDCRFRTFRNQQFNCRSGIPDDTLRSVCAGACGNLSERLERAVCR